MEGGADVESDGRPAGPAPWLGRLAARLFPPSCVLCGTCEEPGRAPVCRRCWSRLPRAVPPRCDRCGAPSPSFADGVRACGECLRWPDGLGRARAPFLMEAGGAALVHALKYGGWTALAGRMGRAMAGPARVAAAGPGDAPGEPAVLVPVPLPPARLRRRGYNQAGLLAEALAAELSWPCDRALEATSGGPRQARLGARYRRENARGRFRARPPAESGPRGEAGGPAALVVDDVLTTGSTAAACAVALARAGWRPLGAVTFARAVSASPRPAEISVRRRSAGGTLAPWWRGSRDD